MLNLILYAHIFYIKNNHYGYLEQDPIKDDIVYDLDFESIFEIHPSIRFVGVCTTDGRLLDAQYKKGIKPLLTDSGLQQSVMRTAIRSTTRKGDEGLMGRPNYSITVYDNVKRATIPFDDELLFIASFEKESPENLIVPKIIEKIIN